MNRFILSILALLLPLHLSGQMFPVRNTREDMDFEYQIKNSVSLTYEYIKQGLLYLILSVGTII